MQNLWRYLLVGVALCLIGLGFVYLNDSFTQKLSFLTKEVRMDEARIDKAVTAGKIDVGRPSLEMQKKCSDQAEHFYRVSGFATRHADLSDHYSGELGHCFVTFVILDRTKDSSSLSIWIFDAFEGMSLGQYMQSRGTGEKSPEVLLCAATLPNGSNKDCNSLSLWKFYVSAYQ